MVIALLFLLLAMVMLYKSVRDLQALFHPGPADPPLRGCRQRLAHITALILWVSAGLIALSTGITKVIERIIFSLQ